MSSIMPIIQVCRLTSASVSPGGGDTSRQLLKEDDSRCEAVTCSLLHEGTVPPLTAAITDQQLL